MANKHTQDGLIGNSAPQDQAAPITRSLKYAMEGELMNISFGSTADGTAAVVAASEIDAELAGGRGRAGVSEEEGADKAAGGYDRTANYVPRESFKFSECPATGFDVLRGPGDHSKSRMQPAPPRGPRTDPPSFPAIGGKAPSPIPSPPRRGAAVSYDLGGGLVNYRRLGQSSVPQTSQEGDSLDSAVQNRAGGPAEVSAEKCVALAPDVGSSCQPASPHKSGSLSEQAPASAQAPRGPRKPKLSPSSPGMLYSNEDANGDAGRPEVCLQNKSSTSCVILPIPPDWRDQSPAPNKLPGKNGLQKEVLEPNLFHTKPTPPALPGHHAPGSRPLLPLPNQASRSMDMAPTSQRSLPQLKMHRSVSPPVMNCKSTTTPPTLPRLHRKTDERGEGQPIDPNMGKRRAKQLGAITMGEAVGAYTEIGGYNELSILGGIPGFVSDKVLYMDNGRVAACAARPLQ